MTSEVILQIKITKKINGEEFVLNHIRKYSQHDFNSLIERDHNLSCNNEYLYNLNDLLEEGIKTT